MVANGLGETGGEELTHDNLGIHRGGGPVVCQLNVDVMGGQMNDDIGDLMSYGELTMIKLEEIFTCFDTPYSERKNLPVSTEFWEWRKENKSRPIVLNKAGLVLNRGEDKYGRTIWTADLSSVTPDTLDEARDANVQWKRTEKENKERARIYMRQCERAKYSPGGQFGGPV